MRLHLLPATILAFAYLASANNDKINSGNVKNDGQNMSGKIVNSILPSKRVEYMRKANEALYRQSGVCPFAAFGAIIVNHTADAIVCEGANFRTGDPTIHGEISAINACTKVFEERGMTATEIFAAWGELSLYTNAESCPMCASAIRWAGFKEYVYGTTIQHNYDSGWGVLTMSSYDIFQQSRQLPGYQTVMIGQILTNETDPLFSWQYQPDQPCPNGCTRVASATRGSTCSNATLVAAQGSSTRRSIGGRAMIDLDSYQT